MIYNRTWTQGQSGGRVQPPAGRLGQAVERIGPAAERRRAAFLLVLTVLVFPFREAATVSKATTRLATNLALSEDNFERYVAQYLASGYTPFSPSVGLLFAGRELPDAYPVRGTNFGNRDADLANFTGGVYVTGIQPWDKQHNFNAFILGRGFALNDSKLCESYTTDENGVTTCANELAYYSNFAFEFRPVYTYDEWLSIAYSVIHQSITEYEEKNIVLTGTYGGLPEYGMPVKRESNTVFHKIKTGAGILDGGVDLYSSGETLLDYENAVTFYYNHRFSKAPSEFDSTRFFGVYHIYSFLDSTRRGSDAVEAGVWSVPLYNYDLTLDTDTEFFIKPSEFDYIRATLKYRFILSEELNDYLRLVAGWSETFDDQIIDGQNSVTGLLFGLEYIWVLAHPNKTRGINLHFGITGEYNRPETIRIDKNQADKVEFNAVMGVVVYWDKPRPEPEPVTPTPPAVPFGSNTER